VCSWGFATCGRELRDAIKDALAEGVLVFASASNAGLNEGKPTYPSRKVGVYSIGACDRFGHAADFTSPNARYLFPGKDITSTYPRYLAGASPNATKCLSGCSMATAVASGLAARILGYAEVCGLDRLELRKDERMEDIFKSLFRRDSEKYIFPWDRIPQGTQSPVEWLRFRFFPDI